METPKTLVSSTNVI